MCTAPTHVRFTPNSDRESEIPQKAMSALLPKADTATANRYLAVHLKIHRLRGVKNYGQSQYEL
jgi:hypothetical protein